MSKDKYGYVLTSVFVTNKLRLLLSNPFKFLCESYYGTGQEKYSTSYSTLLNIFQTTSIDENVKCKGLMTNQFTDESGTQFIKSFDFLDILSSSGLDRGFVDWIGRKILALNDDLGDDQNLVTVSCIGQLAGSKEDRRLQRTLIDENKCTEITRIDKRIQNNQDPSVPDSASDDDDEDERRCGAIIKSLDIPESEEVGTEMSLTAQIETADNDPGEKEGKLRRRGRGESSGKKESCGMGSKNKGIRGRKKRSDEESDEEYKDRRRRRVKTKGGILERQFPHAIIEHMDSMLSKRRRLKGGLDFHYSKDHKFSSTDYSYFRITTDGLAYLARNWYKTPASTTAEFRTNFKYFEQSKNDVSIYDKDPKYLEPKKVGNETVMVAKNNDIADIYPAHKLILFLIYVSLYNGAKNRRRRRTFHSGNNA